MALKKTGPGRKKRLSQGKDGGPDPIDIHVGKRVKLRRQLLHISQEQLASEIGVTFQQVQKYESGYNRVSASRLYDIAQVLNTPIAYFFEDIGDDVYSNRTTPVARQQFDGLSDEETDFDHDPMLRTETLELVRAYWRIPASTVRKNVLDLLRNMTRRDVE